MTGRRTPSPHPSGPAARRFATRGGGLLLDAFLIVVLCVAAFAAWRTRAHWMARLPALPGFRPALVSATKSTPSSDLLARRSAQAQVRVREFLGKAGVKDSDIVKNFNEERTEAGLTWYESTLEINRPKAFQTGTFLKSLTVFLAESDLSLMRDETNQGRWTLELGDRDHVFQRLVVWDRGGKGS